MGNNPGYSITNDSDDGGDSKRKPGTVMITLVYMDFAVLMLKLDLYQVLCTDCRNVTNFVLSHSMF